MPGRSGRRAIEDAGAAGMGIAAHQHGAGQRIAVIGDQHVADPLGCTHIVKPFDAEFFDEVAAGLLCLGAHNILGRHTVIEHHDNALRILDLQHVMPDRREEIVVV